MEFKDKNRSKIMQYYVDETEKAGGTNILNHPLSGRFIQAHEIAPVKGLYMFELYNAHPQQKISGVHIIHPLSNSGMRSLKRA